MHKESNIFSPIGDSATLNIFFLIKNMATTARNKHRQMLKEAEAAAEAENILFFSDN